MLTPVTDTLSTQPYQHYIISPLDDGKLSVSGPGADASRTFDSLPLAAAYIRCVRDALFAHQI